MENVDTTFIHRRRARVFAQINKESGPIVASMWLNNNVPKDERKEFLKYLPKELRKYEPITD
tara:strand:+ start:223 stop:408 length:186 start_codon:yes stop_codon:yes gene_type:complete